MRTKDQTNKAENPEKVLEQTEKAAKKGNGANK